MNNGCLSNGMENLCVNCKDKNQRIGILYGEECIYSIEYSEIINKCYHLTKIGDTYACELCKNKMFPNEKGICVDIDITGCILTNGRNKECILCEKRFKLNGSICEPVLFPIPNCE